jgi:protein-S-isoprenylcysteine O-methyltransferase Ste14
VAPSSAIGALWVAWLVSWIVAARWSNRTAARPPRGSAIGYRVLTTAGAASLVAGGQLAAHGLILWSAPPAVDWLLVGLAVVGLAISWWARLHLGRLWSSSVTRKADHHIVDTGPYALVRHPIYTGIIVAVAATAALQANRLSFVALALFVVGFWIKARLEERFLRAELGAAAYDAYAGRTGMLFPGL